MRFFTVFTVLAASAMAFAGAIPEIVAKRTTSEIQNAWTDLGSQCGPIIQKFDCCDNDDCTNEIILELVAVIDDCKNNIDGFTGSLGDLSGLVTVIVDVITQITVGLNNHKDQCDSGCPNIISIYAQLDLALSACLSLCFDLCLNLSALVYALLGGWLDIIVVIGLPSVCGLF